MLFFSFPESTLRVSIRKKGLHSGAHLRRRLRHRRLRRLPRASDELAWLAAFFSGVIRAGKRGDDVTSRQVYFRVSTTKMRRRRCRERREGARAVKEARVR